MKKSLVLLLSLLFIATAFGCENPGPANGGCDGDQQCTPLEQFDNLMAPKNGTATPPNGEYEVVIEWDPNFPNYTIYRPVGAENMPILAWGEGGCVKMGESYAEMMMNVASYGIVVIADGPPDKFGNTPGTMMNPVGTALTDGITYIIEKNSDPCSPLYGKVDTQKVAVSGQSCGGLLAIDAAADERVTVTFIMSSGLFQVPQREKKLPKIHTPVIYLNGGPTDVAYAQATKDIEYLVGLAEKDEFDYPIYWANRGIGHMADILQDDGGTFGQYLANWLRYQFFNDPECVAMFEGDDCAYCQDNDHKSKLWTLEKWNGAK